MEFKTGELYYIALGLNSNPTKNRPNPDEIYGIGVFTHIQMAGNEKSYNFDPCMSLNGIPMDRKYCIGEEFNIEANKVPIPQKLKDTFYKLYPNIKKDSIINLSNIINPKLTASSIVEFIQNLEDENKKLKRENKDLKDLHNSTCELLEQISVLYENYNNDSPDYS